MTLPFNDPVFWGAVMALVGVIIGQVLSWVLKRKEQDLDTLTVAVEVMKSNMSDMRSQLDRLKVLVNNSNQELTHTSEKLRASYNYIISLRILYNGLKSRADLFEFKIGDFPDPPPIIYFDLMPDVMDDLTKPEEQ